MTFIHDFDAVHPDRSGDCPVDNHPVSCPKPQGVGQGVISASSDWEIRQHLTGLAHFAPARGRQARPDLIEIKPGKHKKACLTASFCPDIYVHNFLPTPTRTT